MPQREEIHPLELAAEGVGRAGLVVLERDRERLSANQEDWLHKAARHARRARRHLHGEHPTWREDMGPEEWAAATMNIAHDYLRTGAPARRASDRPEEEE